jgi:hypothetical protein
MLTFYQHLTKDKEKIEDLKLRRTSSVENDGRKERWRKKVNLSKQNVCEKRAPP